MNGRSRFILLVAAFALIFLVQSAKAIDISSCQAISSPGAYNLISSFNTTALQADCLTITSDNVTIDGHGFTVGFDAFLNIVTARGIFFNGVNQNVSLTNVTVISYGFNSGRTDQIPILVSAGGNVTINNTIISSTASIGLSLSGTSNNLVNAINVTCNACATLPPVRDSTGTNNTIQNANITNVGSNFAVTITGSTGFKLINATISSNATQVSLSANNTFFQNIVFKSTTIGISAAANVNNFTIDNGTYNGATSFYTSSTFYYNISIINSYANTSTAGGISLTGTGGSRLTIRNTNVTARTSRSLILSNATNAVIQNSVFSSGITAETVLLTTVNNSNFSGNNFIASVRAIHLTSDSGGNTFWNNSFNNTAGKPFIYSDTNSTNGNQYNYTTIGNRYYNGTEIGGVYNLNASFLNQPWADLGFDRPFSLVNLGSLAWNGSGQDWFPWTNHIQAGNITVNLTSPANGASLTVPNATFTANIFTPNTVLNSTLYSNFSGVWAANVTQAGVGNFNQTLSSLAAGVYAWNVLACDAVQCVFDTSGNRTVRLVLSDPPIVNLTSPADGAAILNTSVTFKANFTSANHSIVNSSLWGNFTGVWAAFTVQNGSANFSKTVILSLGIYSWNVLACDDYGQCSYDNSVNRTVVVATISCPGSSSPSTPLICANTGTDKALIPEKGDDGMLPIIVAMAMLALIFAFLYFSTPSQQGSITADAFRMLFLFLSLWSLFGTCWFAYYYATAGSTSSTTFNYTNMTATSNSSGNVTYQIVPVISSATTLSGKDSAVGSVLVAYLQATMWAIIVVGGLTLAAFLYGIVTLAVEALKPKKKFGNKGQGG